MTQPAAPAPDATMPAELFFDQLLGDALGDDAADLDQLPGAYIGHWFIRAHSAEATLDAIAAAAAKLRRKIPGVVEHVRVTPWAPRGENPTWCETHRRFFCDESRYSDSARCWIAPCAAVEVEVSAEGLPIYDGDWTVAGILQRDREGAVTAHSVGVEGASVLAHRDLMGQCAHCAKSRARSTTVLLRHVATGEIRPVGKSCLADYTGGSMRPEILATLTGLAERFNVAVGGVFDDLGDSAPVLDIVAVAAVMVQRHGFVRTGDPIDFPTAARVREIICPSDDRPREMVPADLTAGQRAEAARLIAAISDTEHDDDRDRGSDYLANLRATIAGEWATVTGKRNKVGLLSSLPGAAQRRIERIERDAEREAQAATKVNAHIGEVGQRREFTGTVVICREIDTDWGTSDLLVVDTPEGQVKGFGRIQGAERTEVGEQVTVVGTVKGHGEYQGMAQTNINRARIVRAAK